MAADAWASELARSTLSSTTPTLFFIPDGQCSEAVELRPSRDLVSDPADHPVVGRPEAANLWLRDNPDMAAIDGRTAHRLFTDRLPVPRHARLMADRGGERARPPRCDATCGGSSRPAWWPCSTAGTTCRNWV